MKNTIIVVVLIAVAVSGYFFYGRNKVNAPTDTASTGKLNIDAVCASALTYMTFTDQASADAFVAECKEGKHPEVIEHYKEQMNLGDGASI